MGPDLGRIAELLRPSGFERQSLSGQPVFVREGREAGLFERVDLLLAKGGGALMPSLELLVVRHSELQWRGLLVTGHLRELCTDPEMGWTRLETAVQWEGWARELAVVAPRRLSEFAKSRAAELLSKTREAREAARRVWAVEEEVLRLKPGPATTTLLGRLDNKQRVAHQRVMRLRFAGGRLRWREAHVAAVAALLLQKDEAIVALGEEPELVPPESADRQVRAMMRVLTRIEQTNAIPDSTVWRVRILVDTMLNAKRRGGRTRPRLDA